MGSLSSRKFWLAIVGSVVAFANAYWALGLTVDQVWMFLSPILAYIGIEGVADVVTRAKA